MSNELEMYIKEHLKQGKSFSEIKNSLLSVGWNEKDIDKIILKTQESNKDNVPLPSMPKSKNHSTLEIFVNIASFILLWIIVTSLGTLFFQIINKYFPDALAATKYGYYSNFRVSVINYAIASLVVAFPMYLWTIRFWFKGFSRDSQKEESRLSKWITYIILLVAGGTMVGDLIRIIFNFLEGELEVRFILKALTILVIAGLVFAFYFLERKKIQYKKEVSSQLFKILGGIAIGLVVLGIIFGFLASGSPATERMRKFDLERVSNLGSISVTVSSFARDNNRLPVSLDEMRDNALYNRRLPKIVDPQTQEEYQYRVISISSYELCANFSLSTLESFPQSGSLKWRKHDSGRVCETQIVTF